jgi:uncharacterized NAD-dependent epimerase/dehydratase family protein
MCWNVKLGDTAAGVMILVAFMAILTGILKACGPTLIILQHPATREVVECDGAPWDNWSEVASIEMCTEGYEASGYVRKKSY